MASDKSPLSRTGMVGDAMTVGHLEKALTVEHLQRGLTTGHLQQALGGSQTNTQQIPTSSTTASAPAPAPKAPQE